MSGTMLVYIEVRQSSVCDPVDKRSRGLDPGRWDNRAEDGEWKIEEEKPSR
jgi:hypothetical protein